MRNLLGILKDKVSLIKATLLLSKKSTSFNVAVLRATTHFPADPPPETTLDDVLALGHHHRPAASAVVDSLLRRLRRTHNAYVALKCLLTLHHILARGSPVLKDQISSAIGPHNNLLSLSNFRDESDPDTWELSAWVRWYAAVLEQGLFLGHLSRLTGQNGEALGQRISTTSLLNEMGLLVGTVEQICESPESLHCQRINLVYEIMKLVGEDYRMTMREILVRIAELGKRIDDLRDEELNDFWVGLKKLEECKEKVVLMFLNKKMNDGGWDLIAQMRKDVEGVKQRRERLRLVEFQGSGSTRLDGEIRPLGTRGKRWLDVPWNPLVVSQAC